MPSVSPHVNSGPHGHVTQSCMSLSAPQHPRRHLERWRRPPQSPQSGPHWHRRRPASVPVDALKHAVGVINVPVSGFEHTAGAKHLRLACVIGGMGRFSRLVDDPFALFVRSSMHMSEATEHPQETDAFDAAGCILGSAFGPLWLPWVVLRPRWPVDDWYVFPEGPNGAGAFPATRAGAV